ncbi:MAG: GNAT family N-acetyltransferase [Planctomycetota bacterium]
MSEIITNVQLRQIQPSDLPQLFEFQRDAESNQMAFIHPRSRQDFDEHWEKVLVDPTVTVRAILAEDNLAGSISCYHSEGSNYIGYWLGRQFWGRGIATAALRMLLDEVDTRPLLSRVAVTNIGSIRVLEKCGFQEVRRQWSPATQRFAACEEVLMELLST